MTFAFGDYKISITNSVIENLNSFRQTGNKHEKGGVLLGSVYDNVIEINRISVPTFMDKSTKFSFTRDKKSAQTIIDYEFINSEGKIIYLGEWHTHPENFPSPSGQDKKMIKEQFKNNSLNVNFIIMLILGIKGYYLSVYDGEKILKLDVITDNI
jgi:integrative and conjugative element protein (TIGR02256 family)